MFKVSILLVIVFVALAGSEDPKRIVCGYASWAIYRQGLGALYPKQIDATPCTHLLYAYVGVTPEGEIDILDQNGDIDKGGLKDFASLKSQIQGGQVLISVGGHNSRSNALSGVAASSFLRENFVNSVTNFLIRWNFDGIDIAWQYPQKADNPNFVTLLKMLQESLSSNHYVLSVTVPHDPTDGYDVSEISNLVDFVNIMTFDYHTPGSDEKITGHNSPLYNDQMGLSISTSISSWISRGLDKAKINVGLATYGHSYSLYYEDKHGVGAQAYLGISGPYTQIPGFLGYNEICYAYDDWEKESDSNSRVPYQYSSYNWITYDDETSITEKSEYIVAEGLGGAFIWSLDTDDFQMNCAYGDTLANTVFGIFNPAKVRTHKKAKAKARL